MKGLILSGGKGTRLRPLTYTRAKQLLPLANKPVLFYAIEALLDAGIRDIGIIVGDTAAEIEAAVGDGARWGAEVHITYIQQEAPLGLAHAVLTAEPYLGDDRFVMFLGDNLIGESLQATVGTFAAPECAYRCHILLKEVDTPSQFGIAELESTPVPVPAQVLAGPAAGELGAAGEIGAPGGHGGSDVTAGVASVRVRRLVEKPAAPASNLALVGVYCFDASIFTAARAIQPSARGELEITDAIQWLIDQRHAVHAQRLHGYWIDTGKMADVLDANRQVLLDLVPQIDPSATISASSVLQGTVTVQAGAVIDNCVIRGPAIIGERCVVRNAYIGPFTSIYHDTEIIGSEVEYSIVLEHSRITNVPGRIEESLIGRESEVFPAQRKPRGYKLMLGDHSRVGVLPG